MEEQTLPEAGEPEDKEVMALPAPSSSTTDKITANDLAIGSSTALTELGPVVLNADGTMQRITNWHEMSEIERQRTFRLIGKRNQVRLQKLREKGVSLKPPPDVAADTEIDPS